VTRHLSGERVPADPERARRNREELRHLVARRDPALALAVARLRQEGLSARRAARSRS
jgi:hypothetical protein